MTDEELEKRGFYKLPNTEMLTNLNMLVQNVPAHLSNAVQRSEANKAVEKLTENAYRVIIKDGMHLGKSKATNGAFKGMAFSADNDLKAMPDLVKLSVGDVDISVAPQLALGFFNIMSAATGQYFMASINNRLSNMEKGMNEIHNFLKLDKRSRIEADESVILQTYRDLQFIMGNEIERIATSSDLKRIKNEALSNIRFFKTQALEEYNKIEKGLAYKEFTKIYSKCREIYPQYMCAVRNYCNAFFLETIISGMTDPYYLLNVHADIQNQIFDYEDSFDQCEKKISYYAKNSKELNKRKKIPEGAEKVANFIPASNPWLLGVKILITAGVEYDDYRESSSKAKKDLAEEQANQFQDVCSNLTPLNETVKLIEEYRTMQNSPIELIVHGETAHIRNLDKELVPID